MASVIIVEDDPWMADCYTTWLTATGHAVRHARDSQGALDLLEDLPPQVILLDLFLPHANATQLLHTLQSYADWAHIPVILCSSALPENLPSLEAYGVCKIANKASLTPKLLNQWVGELAHATI